MQMPTFTVSRERRSEIEQAIRNLPAVLAGSAPDPLGIGKGFRARVGFTWYSLVAQAFEVKSRGGTDEAGDSWARNSAAYLAYGKGPKSSRMGTGRSPRWQKKRGSGNYTPKQLKQWNRLYARILGELIKTMTPAAAKQVAAAKATKAMDVPSLISTVGNRADSVLVDTGRLRRSITFGELTESGAGAEYVKKNRDQIFEEQPSRLVVGTNVDYAGPHHRGGSGLPQRKLWPDELPPSWVQQIDRAISTGFDRIGEALAR